MELRSIEEISSDLGRYKRIADYFKKHPERKTPNEFYIIGIARKLLDISEMELPKELEESCSNLFDFFYNSYDI